MIKLQVFTLFYTEHLRRLLLVLGVQQYQELSVVRWNIWCKPFLTLTYTLSARSVTGLISQYLKYLKLYLFVFPMVMNVFQLIHVILKILNIANKSNDLLQQHYFNHFHFTWKCFFWNKNQTKLYKLNRRSKTMVGIPLILHITAIFQSDKLQLSLWYITLKWSDNFWKLLLWYSNQRDKNYRFRKSRPMTIFALVGTKPNKVKLAEWIFCYLGTCCQFWVSSFLVLLILSFCTWLNISWNMLNFHQK